MLPLKLVAPIVIDTLHRVERGLAQCCEYEFVARRLSQRLVMYPF